MRTRSRLVAATAAALLLAGCATTDREAVAATIDGTTISRGELLDHVHQVVGGPAEGGEVEDTAEATRAAQQHILGLLIQSTILEDVAAERGIEIDEEEAEARFQEQIERFGGEEQLAEALRAEQLTLDLYRNAVIPFELRLRALREDIVGSDTLPTRTVRHILVSSEEEAQEIVEQLEDGADFAELAEERSEDAGSGARGGDLGTQPRGVYVPEFEAAVWDAEVGEIVGPVETDYGYHIIEVTAEGEVDIADVDPRLIDQIAGPELQELFQTALSDADVSVAAGLGQWDPTQFAVVEPETVGRGQPAPPAGDEQQPVDAGEPADQ